MSHGTKVPPEQPVAANQSNTDPAPLQSCQETNNQYLCCAKDFAIGVLSVTAVILLATLLLMNVFVPRQAYAIPQAGTAGNYVASAARLEETAELLIILNTQQRLINVYGFNVQAGQVDMIQQIDIERITKDLQRFQKEQGNRLDPGMMRGPGARQRR